MTVGYSGLSICTSFVTLRQTSECGPSSDSAYRRATFPGGEGFGAAHYFTKEAYLCHIPIKSILRMRRLCEKNATKEERHLWYDFLCSYPVRFRRQVVIRNFIVDFYCAEAELAIELDGSQHYSDEGKQYDADRTGILNNYGIKVLRFSNADVNRNFRGVCEHIDIEVQKAIKKR